MDGGGQAGHDAQPGANAGGIIASEVDHCWFQSGVGGRGSGEEDLDSHWSAPAPRKQFPRKNESDFKLIRYDLSFMPTRQKKRGFLYNHT